MTRKAGQEAVRRRDGVSALSGVSHCSLCREGTNPDRQNRCQTWIGGNEREPAKPLRMGEMRRWLPGTVPMGETRTRKLGAFPCADVGRWAQGGPANLSNVEGRITQEVANLRGGPLRPCYAASSSVSSGTRQRERRNRNWRCSLAVPFRRNAIRRPPAAITCPWRGSRPVVKSVSQDEKSNVQRNSPSSEAVRNASTPCSPG